MAFKTTKILGKRTAATPSDLPSKGWPGSPWCASRFGYNPSSSRHLAVPTLSFPSLPSPLPSLAARKAPAQASTASSAAAAAAGSIAGAGRVWQPGCSILRVQPAPSGSCWHPSASTAVPLLLLVTPGQGESQGHPMLCPPGQQQCQ